jgi:hypothetical protein
MLMNQTKYLLLCSCLCIVTTIMNSDRNESFCGGQEGGIIISKIASTPFKKQVDWRQKSIGVTSTRTKSV